MVAMAAAHMAKHTAMPGKMTDSHKNAVTFVCLFLRGL